MEKKGCSSEGPEVRKGPWTMEEDSILVNYIANHGKGIWNSLAKSAGLRRTGKSCRLRWLNYLRPDVRRGNITPEEQLLIMELHSKLGNRWSKIAKHVPGRTDNEIKNYWRTKIHKHVNKHRDSSVLCKCDVSKQFKHQGDTGWMDIETTTGYPTGTCFSQPWTCQGNTEASHASSLAEPGSSLFGWSLEDLLSI